jgi:CBS domain-containing protein
VKLGELLDQRRVLVPLEARTVRDATKRLAATLIASGVIADLAKFTELLEDEWPEDIVSVAGRAFLPHFRTEAAKQLALAVGISAEPLSRSGDPGHAARIVVLVVAPTSEASAYLRAMAAVARVLSTDETLAALHAARSPEDVMRVAGLADMPVPGDVTVRDVMTPGVTTVPPDMPLREAAHVLLSRRVSSAPVVGSQGEVLGMLTDRHLMNFLLPETVSAMSTGQVRAIKRRKSKESPIEPGATPVREVMDRSVLCLEEDQTIADVAALMLSKEVERFPVTRDGTLVGYLTRADIVRKLLGS